MNVPVRTVRQAPLNLHHVATSLMSILSIPNDVSLVEVLQMQCTFEHSDHPNLQALTCWLEAKLMSDADGDVISQLPAAIGDLLDLLETAEQSHCGKVSREVSHDR